MFFTDFTTGLGPWEHRLVAQDTPTGEDCARVNARGQCVLRVKGDPLRVGHLWVPPETFTFTTGYAEARMRFGSPLGAHGAFWAQACNTYVTPDDHELDIVENFGNPIRSHCGYWYSTSGPEATKTLGCTQAIRVQADDWHVYGCEVAADHYTWTVDGRTVGRVAVNDGTRPKFLVLSMLVDDWEKPNLSTEDLSQYKTRIDWVRVTAGP